MDPFLTSLSERIGTEERKLALADSMLVSSREDYLVLPTMLNSGIVDWWQDQVDEGYRTVVHLRNVMVDYVTDMIATEMDMDCYEIVEISSDSDTISVISVEDDSDAATLVVSDWDAVEFDSDDDDDN
jgi:hypothetical protein